MKKKQFAIIGLGRFGGSICKELYEMGHEVLAIDDCRDKVENYVNYSTHAIISDCTDEKSLKSLGVSNFDNVIVAIGENIQASILCTLLLKEEGVKNVWVKANNDYHHKVLEKIGADKIIHPEKDMGKRIAQHLVSEKIIDYIDLSDDYSILEFKASDKINNKSIIQLDIRAKYGCTILAIKRGESVNISPFPTDVIKKDDILVMIGDKEGLKKIEEECI